jgi:rubrerythrin
MSRAPGDVGAHGVERDLRAPAAQEPEEEESGGRARSRQLKRAGHRAYYTTGDEMASEPVATCWVCGALMREIRCKLVCPHCGYTRDCSDP